MKASCAPLVWIGFAKSPLWIVFYNATLVWVRYSARASLFLLYCVGFSFCFNYLIMTQGLFSQRTEPKLDLSHKLSPRSPTMAFSKCEGKCYPNTYLELCWKMLMLIIFHIMKYNNIMKYNVKYYEH